MGDDDELSALGHGAHIAGKPYHIVVVQSGLNLVHHHKGGGPDLQNGKVQGDGHKGLLPAGQQGDDLQRLTRGLNLNLDAAVEDILRVLQLQGGLTPAKKLQEGLAECLVDGLKLPFEDGLHLASNIGDNLLQFPFRPVHVVPLVCEIGIPFIDPLELLDGAYIDVPQAGNGPLQLSNAAAGPGNRLNLHPLLAGGLVGQLIVLPQLVQKLLLLHGGGNLLLLQAGHFSLQTEQLLVFALALPGGLDTLPLQLQLLLVHAVDGVGSALVLQAEGSQSLLLLGDLLGKALVFLLIVRHQGPALVPVPGHGCLQALQLLQTRAGGLPLRLQSGLDSGELGHLLGDAGSALLQVGLPLGLALGLAL